MTRRVTIKLQDKPEPIDLLIDGYEFNNYTGELRLEFPSGDVVYYAHGYWQSLYVPKEKIDTNDEFYKAHVTASWDTIYEEE